MAMCSLIRSASHQLRLLPRARQSSVVVMGQVRWCQDDSKIGKSNSPRRRDRSEQKTVKTSGPAVNLLEKDLHNILQEQQKEEKLQERSSLQCRIDLLLSLGCTMDQIQDRIKVLGLTEQIVLKRAAMLKNAGRTPITVDLLLSCHHVKSTLLQKSLRRKDETEKALCKLLHCSIAELRKLQEKHVSLTRMRLLHPKALFEKEELLHSYGITWEEIRDCPEILNIRVANLRKRLDKLKSLREHGKIHFDRYPLNFVVTRARNFDCSLKRVLLEQIELDGSPISYATIGKRLGVTAKDIEGACINFYKVGHSRILKKIDYLLGEGISNIDIVSHIYIMKYHLQAIQKAMEKSKSVVMTNPPSIYVVLSFLRSGHLPQRSLIHSRQRIYIASILGIEAKNLPIDDYIRPLWSADRIFVKRNFDFLVSEGFSVQDILSCLVLLVHDPSILQDYYQKLRERPEVAAYVEKDVEIDRPQTLSLLQYVMEKDMNFNSVGFHIDVEYDQAQQRRRLLNVKWPIKTEP